MSVVRILLITKGSFASLNTLSVSTKRYHDDKVFLSRLNFLAAIGVYGLGWNTVALLCIKLECLWLAFHPRKPGKLDFFPVGDGFCKEGTRIIPPAIFKQDDTTSQLSNIWWMPNSVSKGFDTAMRTGSSRRFKRYPTTYRWLSSQPPFNLD